MNCKRGGSISVRHTNILDFEANLLEKVCNDEETERRGFTANYNRKILEQYTKR